MKGWIAATSLVNPDTPDFHRDVYIRIEDISKIFVSYIPLPFDSEGRVLNTPENHQAYVMLAGLHRDTYVYSGPYPHEEARERARKLAHDPFWGDDE